MSDVRLIDAKELTRWLEMVLSNANPLERKARAAFSEVLARVKTMPDIDAVPVVRCRDCVCCSMWNDQLICSRISDVMHGYYHGTIEVVKPDDYCSNGIRQRAKPLDGGVDNA